MKLKRKIQNLTSSYNLKRARKVGNSTFLFIRLLFLYLQVALSLGYLFNKYITCINKIFLREIFNEERLNRLNKNKYVVNYLPLMLYFYEILYRG